MSAIVWLLSALLMLIGSCSQPTAAGYLTPLPSQMMISQPITTVWADVPADLPVGTLIKLVLVMPDGGQQVVGSTDTVMLNRSREAWLTWVTPASPVASAHIFARGGYVSPIAAFRVEDVQVRAFTADKTSVQPGETMTLSWSVSGGASISIYNQTSAVFIGEGLPLEGTLAVAASVDVAEIESVVYTLLISAEDGTIYEIMFPPQIEIPLVKP